MKLLDKDVLYLDNHLIAVNKPAGVVTQGALQDAVRQWLKAKYNKPGNVFLEPIHRLDKPVSGIVLFARTSKALSRLNAQMRAKKIGRWYEALVEGEMEGQGTLEHNILKREYHSIVHPDGKPSKLHYRVIATHPTRLRIELVTGRYHQIRTQLSAIGHPVIGSDQALKLTHVEMHFEHPTTQEQITIGPLNNCL
ncbi:MAG: pseudouridine synthase [Simkaniaceae bacterium]|nr:pseudouridine synthase [Simkaniaceae bacterium]